MLQTDDNNECYFVNTTIGRNEYPLIIDTGSAYLWVYGEDCTDTACTENKRYSIDSDSSSSSASLEETSATSTFALSYVTGSAVGYVVEDNIIVNKLATTQKFKFGMANTVPDFFASYPVSGIFGLPSNDSSSIESIISALYDSHAIGVQRFSISIGQINPNDNWTNAGIFAIGDPIEELYNGDIHNVPLIPNDSNYWMIKIDNVSVNDVVVQFNETVQIDGQDSTIHRSAVVDSGTTVLAIPQQDAIDLHAFFEDSITDGTNFAIFCNSTANINLMLNDKNYSIVPELYLGPSYPDGQGYDGYCVSNIQGIDLDSWILGAVFLKSVYVDFNIDKQEIGFAERNTDVIITSTATSASAATNTASVLSTSTTDNRTQSSTTAEANHATYNAGFSLLAVLSSIISVLVL